MSATGHVYIILADTGTRRHLVKVLRAKKYRPTPFAEGKDFLESVGFLAPGVALVDLHLPDMAGMALLQELLAQREDIPVVMTAACADIRMVVQAIKRGADDFLEQPFGEKPLLETIEHATSLLQERVDRQTQKHRTESYIQSLTKRELQIARALEITNDNEKVAEQLHLSVRTIEAYRSRIMKKCGVRRFSEALLICRRDGVLNGSP